MTDTIIRVLKIDPEFRELIPPLSDDEYQRLKDSLIKNGYQSWREPIITWNGTIIDGHNRYSICIERGIEFRSMEMQFESRDAAKLWIVKNQLKRRNLPVAAIGDLKLEEKEIVARQTEKRLHLSKGRGKKAPPNLGEVSDKHDGETLEQLAADIPIGRESLRKLDVIKQRAKDGDPVAIEERQALLSGEKKSIHGAYVRVTGDKKQRTPSETIAPDGRKICVMCGEPIDEGDSLPSRPTVHKKCEKEYQRDWNRRKKKQRTEDGRRICSTCGEPIDEGDAYDHHPWLHKACFNKNTIDARRRRHEAENITIGDVNEVIEHDKAELKRHLMLDVSSALSNLQATLDRYESMGVAVTEDESKRIRDAIDPLVKAIQSITE